MDRVKREALGSRRQGVLVNMKQVTFLNSHLAFGYPLELEEDPDVCVLDFYDLNHKQPSPPLAWRHDANLEHSNCQMAP